MIELSAIVERRVRFVATGFLVVGIVIAACRPSRPPGEPPGRAMSHSLIPLPASVSFGSGEPFSIDSTLAIVASGGSEIARTAEHLAVLLRAPTGFAIPVLTDSAAPRPIALRVNPSASGEEYELIVTGDSVRLSGTPSGVFRGVQTLRQLLPPAIESHMRRDTTFTIPAVTITDRPRFAWRGSMLDVSRHFFTVDEVKQFIDILALYKMNVLHLHLADDQGWRIEIKSRPLLAEKGSVTEVAGRPGGGGYFTQEQYADIVRYAQERYVTVVPEIDMPSHINAALIAYPELACGRRAPGPYTGIDVGWSTICVDSAQSYALLEDVIREISAITPGPWFHLGGDEVQTLTPEQYTSFVQRVQDIVMRNGKAAVGWEEIAAAQLEPGTIVQLWRADSLKHALGPGVKILLSPAKKAYIDQKYDPTTELGLRWAGYVDVRDSYDWNPGTYLHNVGEDRIAGVEAPIWTETLRNISAVEYLAVPRLPAIAEVGWSAQGSRAWEDFRLRLAAQAARWRMLGINYYRSSQIPW
jgi:hexosaminidase